MAHIDETTLKEPPIGAHLITPRKAFNHHGLYIGHGKVIHYSGMARSFGLKDLKTLPSLVRYGSIVKTSLKYFCDGHGFKIVEHKNPRFSGAAAVERAKKRLYERSYYIYSNNCEHFVNWCLEDEFKSPFITRFLLGISLILAFFQWFVSSKTFKAKSKHAALIFGTLCSISGSLASAFLTLQALQPAKGIRARERTNRRNGRIALEIGTVLGIMLGILGVAKKSKFFVSLAPYFTPTLSGLCAYGICRTLDTNHKEKIRKERKQTKFENS